MPYFSVTFELRARLVRLFKEPGHGGRGLPYRIEDVEQPEKDTALGTDQDIKDEERRETEGDTDGRGAVLDQEAAGDQGEGGRQRKAEEKDGKEREDNRQQDTPPERPCKLLQEL